MPVARAGHDRIRPVDARSAKAIPAKAGAGFSFEMAEKLKRGIPPRYIHRRAE